MEFFKIYWDVIEKDLTQEVEESRSSKRILSSFNPKGGRCGRFIQI